MSYAMWHPWLDWGLVLQVLAGNLSLQPKCLCLVWWWWFVFNPISPVTTPIPQCIPLYPGVHNLSNNLIGILFGTSKPVATLTKLCMWEGLEFSTTIPALYNCIWRCVKCTTAFSDTKCLTSMGFGKPESKNCSETEVIGCHQSCQICSGG